MYFVYDGNTAFLSNQINEGYEVGKVNWRDLNITVNIISKYPFKLNTIKKKKDDNLFPLLKSNLQKQVRRKDFHAVATCKLMLELNEFECLRRLSVIAAEDVEISKETSVIVWLMAAVSKNYLLSEKDKKFILIYVGNLVSHNICRRLSNDMVETTNIYDIINSNHSDKEYIAGIFFRLAYGGSLDDLTMINKICNNVIMKDKNLLSFKNKMLINTELEINEAAVDFHIYPNICKEISNDTGIDDSTVKELIWNCSSGINLRVNNNQNIDERWEIIQKSFDFRTKLYINILFNNI